MFLRFFFYLLLIYLVYRLIRSLFGSFLDQRRGTTKVHGSSHPERQARSDIDEAEIEDATFEEIDEDSE